METKMIILIIGVIIHIAIIYRLYHIDKNKMNIDVKQKYCHTFVACLSLIIFVIVFLSYSDNSSIDDNVSEDSWNSWGSVSQQY